MRYFFDSKIEIIGGIITRDVFHPRDQLEIKKMGVNIRYSRMYNVGTYEPSSSVKNYQMGLNHTWY